MKTKINENPPADWACFICGQHFKIGRFNRVYVFRFGEWVATRSTSLSVVHKAIEAKNKRITDPREIRRHVTKKHKDLPEKVDLSKESAIAKRDDIINKVKTKKILVSRSLV